jgi:hypothetical protein
MESIKSLTSSEEIPAVQCDPSKPDAKIITGLVRKAKQETYNIAGYAMLASMND